MKKLEFVGNKNIISIKLKQFRRSKGLTQCQIAAKLQVMGVNLDQQMVSKIESNRRLVTDYELACLCKILEISPNDLWEETFSQIESRFYE